VSDALRLDIVTEASELARVALRAGRAPKLALDTEANGLFAFEARLCVVQLAWREDDRDVVAIVDALATPVDALAPLLDERGPTKILHDLTFDARLLAAAGLTLRRVGDTEVTARLLGRSSLGLASLLGGELGIPLSKALQRHDWSRRPLASSHVEYLAGDVAHLLALDARLEAEAAARDLLPEIACETAYKLETANGPEGDGRPPWARAKGSSDLDVVGRAVLRRLLTERDEIARAIDFPPFQVIGSRELVLVAARRPRTHDELIKVLGRWPAKFPNESRRLLGAVGAGIEDGEVPPEETRLAFPPPPPRLLSERRRRVEQSLGAWRRREAATKGWAEQAVLPGHCSRDLAVALADADDDEARRDAIACIRGLGDRRREWFAGAWLELARTILDAPAATPDAG